MASFHGPRFARAEAEAEAEAAEDENPQSWGEALLREVLAHVKAPFEVMTLHVPSYGHAAKVEARSHAFTVSVGFVDESEGWLLFVDGSRTLASVPDVDETRDLLRQLHAGLAGIEGLSRVRWADRASFDRNDPAWQSSPLA